MEPIPQQEPPLDLCRQLFITEGGVPATASAGEFIGTLQSVTPAEYEHVNNIQEVTYRFNPVGEHQVDAVLDLQTETLSIRVLTDDSIPEIVYADGQDLVETLNKIATSGEGVLEAASLTGKPDAGVVSDLPHIKLSPLRPSGLTATDLGFSYAQLITAAQAELLGGQQLTAGDLPGTVSLRVGQEHWTPQMRESSFVQSKQDPACTCFYLTLAPEAGPGRLNFELKHIVWG